MKYVKKAEKGNELTFELRGEDHTFAGLLVSKLLEDKDVEIAQYNIPHPLIGEPEFYIRTKKTKPKDSPLELHVALRNNKTGLCVWEHCQYFEGENNQNSKIDNDIKSISEKSKKTFNQSGSLQNLV